MTAKPVTAVDETIRWRPILPDLETMQEAGEVSGFDHMVLWNPCDGLHYADIYLNAPRAIDTIIQEARDGIYTHFAIVIGPNRSGKPS